MYQQLDVELVFIRVNFRWLGLVVDTRFAHHVLLFPLLMLRQVGSHLFNFCARVNLHSPVDLGQMST